MKKSQNKHLKFLSLLLISASIYNTYIVNNTSATNYSPYCVSEKCRKAADDAEAASQAATEAANQANTVQGEIDKLDAEINELQAQITQNKALVEDLKVKIEATTKKLTRQRAALAKLSVKIYHSDIDAQDAVEILAGSESISDLAETENRQTTVSEQITKAAKEVNNTKKDLEQQQVSARQLLKDNESKASEVTSKRSEQASIKDKYENDAAAYQAASDEALKTVTAEIQAQAAAIARANSRGRKAAYNTATGVGASGWWGTNTYPQSGANCPDNVYYYASARVGFYGGYGCQCTSYAGWKAYEKHGVFLPSYGRWGHAAAWGDSARRYGFTVTTTPAANTAAYQSAAQAGYWTGHVVWVESVNSDGTVNITEYNNTRSSVSGRSGDFGARTGVPATDFAGYIHFD